MLLLVEEKPEGKGYKYFLVSEKWDYLPFESPPLKDAGGGAGATPRRYVESLYEALTKRVLINLDDVNEFARELSAEGANLAQQLFPPELVRLLWQERDRLTVHVKSWEPYIPWEIARLVHPDSREVDERFLAEYDLVRSFSGSSRPKRLKLDRWSVLVADYPNGLEKSLAAEKTALLDMLEKRGITPADLPTTPGAVYAALGAPSSTCCTWSATGAPIMTTSTAPSS